MRKSRNIDMDFINEPLYRKSRIKRLIIGGIIGVIVAIAFICGMEYFKMPVILSILVPVVIGYGVFTIPYNLYSSNFIKGIFSASAYFYRVLVKGRYTMKGCLGTFVDLFTIVCLFILGTIFVLLVGAFGILISSILFPVFLIINSIKHNMNK